MAYSGINSLVLPEQNTSGKIDSSIPPPYTQQEESKEKSGSPESLSRCQGKDNIISNMEQTNIVALVAIVIAATSFI
jgi:hypothetical protein